MQELRQKVKERQGFSADDPEIEDFIQGKTEAALSTGLGTVSWEDAPMAGHQDITEFRILLAWKNGNKKQESVLATYFPLQK
jgi:hypothetical protein